MTAEEQKRMEALEAENARLRGENSELQDKLLAAQQTLAKYTKMLSARRRKDAAFPRSRRNSRAAFSSRRWILRSRRVWTPQ